MEFLLNKLKLDPSYLASVEENSDVIIHAQYSAFKKYSSAHVMAFKKMVDKYGSVHKIPRNVLKQYRIPIKSLFDANQNLRMVLQKEVNENTKNLEYFRKNEGENSFIYSIALRKRDKLYKMIEYFDDIEILNVTIEFCMENDSHGFKIQN